jgi:hypothetical protein
MVNCPQCELRQYAAAPYLEAPRCVGCDTPLDAPEPRAPSTGRQIVDLTRPAAINPDSR